MVRVYRVRHKSTASGFVYSLAWSSGGARKVQQFADVNEAIEEGRLRAKQIATGRIDSANISKPDRDELAAARQLAGAMPLLAVVKEWRRAHDLTRGSIVAAAEAWAARNTGTCKPVKLAKVLREFLAAKTRAGKNVAHDHSSIFNAIARELGEYEIANLTSVQLDRYLAKHEHPVTRNTYRKRFVSVWRWAQRRGYLPRDAKTEAEMTERAHEPAPVVGIISSAVFSKLLAHFHDTHPDYLAPLVIAGFCGLRRAEVHGQEWSDINLEQGHIRVSRAKRGTPARRLVPLPPAAIDWLMLCPDREGPLCWNLAIDMIRRHSTEAGFNLPENCFRHSFISHKVAATGDIARVSLDSGNSPKEIQRHYRELVTEKEGKVWFEIRPATGHEMLLCATAS